MCNWFKLSHKSKLAGLNWEGDSIINATLLYFTLLLLAKFKSASWRHPWYSGSVLDCWPSGRAIDPAPGAWFITNFISLAQVVSDPV